MQHFAFLKNDNLLNYCNFEMRLQVQNSSCEYSGHAGALPFALAFSARHVVRQGVATAKHALEMFCTI